MSCQVTTRLRELHTTIEAGERHRNAVLQQIAVNLEEWTTKVCPACIRLRASVLCVGRRPFCWLQAMCA
jgi:hypothetical protein